MSIRSIVGQVRTFETQGLEESWGERLGHQGSIVRTASRGQVAELRDLVELVGLEPTLAGRVPMSFRNVTSSPRRQELGSAGSRFSIAPICPRPCPPSRPPSGDWRGLSRRVEDLSPYHQESDSREPRGGKCWGTAYLAGLVPVAVRRHPLT